LTWTRNYWIKRQVGRTAAFFSKPVPGSILIAALILAQRRFERPRRRHVSALPKSFAVARKFLDDRSA
jgi:hypothetical protein